ncbi:hypothetical protein AURDEDRAFT_116097 [Auricularia subglabra TFB-10046 SS5]|uniref:Uncharacterized protein n=1 Tax=Auricularia subglabra (strain TFB-10046 / SS5) TaxID=717982 RepID=J0D1C3_AURST|nr:hypothetical protein AURDEDRAFT_116097 [Auricularia subglabra TFB-10046 SS5]
MLADDFEPKPTAFSSPEFAHPAQWSPLDLVIGAGAVILDSSFERVLVLYDTETERYRMPWAMHDGPSIAQFVASPFDQVTKETGFAMEKYPLPMLERYYKNPDVRDWRQLQVDTRLKDVYTDEPFYTSFDVFWSPIPGEPESPWLDSKQRMMMWFACRAVLGSPASKNVTFEPFAVAEERLKNEDKEWPDAGGLAALRQLVDILRRLPQRLTPST